MELRKFYGQSGKVYFVTYSAETFWHVFVETKEGFSSVVARTAAIDCGATGDPREANTHNFWKRSLGATHLRKLETA